ncbi:MAG: S9 family peptidase [Leptolyngbya sp. PLA1]|nr:S9 family peptidase [Leptolyngbya sp. PLA1]
MLHKTQRSSVCRIPLRLLTLGVLGAAGTGLAAGSFEPLPAPFAGTMDPPGESARPEKPEKLTLDRIFPKKSFFGPGARGATFSHDGRFLAFLYRPFEERRHGSDLYILDTTTNAVRRITCVSRFAEFQEEARKVREDREKKARKAGYGGNRLAREQYRVQGWNDGLLVDTWKGAAAQGDVPLAGEIVLMLSEDDKGAFGGSLRIGLATLGLSEVDLDESKGSGRATIDDKALKVKGSVELAAEGAGLRIQLKLTEPAQELTASLTRTPPEPPPEGEPRGVLGALGERLFLADVVLPDDADINDEKDGKPVKDPAPRYDGVSTIEWSPKSHELLVQSGGDVYRLTIDLTKWDAPLARPEQAAGKEEPLAKPEGEGTPGADGAGVTPVSGDGAVAGAGEKNAAQPAAEEKIAEKKPKRAKTTLEVATPYRGDLTRLTRTRERESDVQYLPDGSGYTYLRDGALIRVTFGEHQIVQLDPELKDGERMVGYRLSPDMKRLVFLASRGQTTNDRAARVTIVNYRDRFARAQEVRRHMPDDPWPESFSSVYLYDLKGHATEEGKLERVFTRKVGGPRDVMRVPEWSPDSSRIAFAAYDQQQGVMKILEAGFKVEDKKEKKEKKDADQGPEAKTDAKPEAAAQPGDKKAEETEKEPEFKIENARVVYQFLHAGGPNTPGMVRPLYLPDSRRMVFITELSGFRQLHLLDPRYEQLTQVTSGQYELYPFHITRDNTSLFATTTEGDPNQEQVCRIDLNTLAVTRLTGAAGVHSDVAVREDGSLVASIHADFGSPGEFYLTTPGEASTPRKLTDSHPKEARALTTAAPEYFTYENRHGQTIHGHMFKPADWSPDDKRPLLIYVYGGPLGERKMATRGAFAAPSYFFARYMTENHGWVTATIDPRGASGYGAVFEKANFEQVGKPQTEDLVDGAKWFVKHQGVDEKKLALHGWSFGGFQTQMVMYTEPDVFAVGLAGAGPTEWHNYNSWYSTGTIGANEPGKTDLEKYSLLPLAKNLKGKLLLIHGVEDSNVLYQDTVRVYRELLKANKEVNVELFIDPTGGHGLDGDVKTIGRYRKYEDFLVRHLGEGKPASKKEQPAEAAPAPTDAKAP